MTEQKYNEMLKLKGKIIAEGYDLKSAAKEINISYTAFRNKLKGNTAFSIDEVYDLVELLNIEKEEIVEYFFDDMMRNAL